MKRAGYYRLAIAIMLMIGVLFILHHESTKPEFEIQSTIKNTFDNYETVDISVIVYTRDYDLEAMFNEIYLYYIELNGEPDELYVRLFSSKAKYNNSQLCAEKKYIKQ